MFRIVADNRQNTVIGNRYDRREMQFKRSGVAGRDYPDVAVDEAITSVNRPVARYCTIFFRIKVQVGRIFQFFRSHLDGFDVQGRVAFVCDFHHGGCGRTVTYRAKAIICARVVRAVANRHFNLRPVPETRQSPCPGIEGIVHIHNGQCTLMGAANFRLKTQYPGAGNTLRNRLGGAVSKTVAVAFHLRLQP